MANIYARSNTARGYVADARLIRVSVSFGASGAPTIVSGTGMGITSIARTSAGKYTITLRENYKNLLRMSHVFNTSGTAAAPTSPSLYIATDNTSSTTPTIAIVFNAAGTATDPASGEKVYMELEFNNSSLAY